MDCLHCDELVTRGLGRAGHQLVLVVWGNVRGWEVLTDPALEPLLSPTRTHPSIHHPFIHPLSHLALYLLFPASFPLSLYPINLLIKEGIGPVLLLEEFPTKTGSWI